jgi:predicted transcriptional regulator
MERITVIKEILTLVRDGGLLSKTDIAERIGIQHATLESVFSLLSSKGYLQKIDNTTSEPSKVCLCCSACTGCTKKANSPAVYTITEKGKTYLQAK